MQPEKPVPQKPFQQKPSEEKHQRYTVSVRIKPNLTNEPVCLLPFQSNSIKETRPKSVVTYCFDRVFQDSHDNAYIYQHSLQRAVEFFTRKGISTTILAYGQTGSGKTHTLFGHKQKEQKGLIHFIVEDLLSHTQAQGLTPRLSFMQIYKEKASDLTTSAPVLLKENGRGELLLENLRVYEGADREQLLALLERAHANKIFGNSYLNSESSRSHVVFTIEVQGCKLHIVDLCGSEVLTYEFNEQQREETNSINLSLFTLNAVVSDLAAPKAAQKFIPFRNSVLTRVLKESLIDAKKSQIYLFCNVSPELRHQSFSASTLRFGQLAIQIDQAANVSQEKTNLSQQKRDLKAVCNTIDLTPSTNRSPGSYHPPWRSYCLNLLGKNTKIYELTMEEASCDLLILHAYGYGCCGQDWNLHVSYLTRRLNANIYSVDFPGFGESEGKKFTSRAEKFEQEGGPIDFMAKLFQALGFGPKRKLILMGYDLGAAIALSCSLHKKLSRSLQLLIAFHPTWTDKIERLALVTLPTLLLWFPAETFHLVSAGQKMAKVIRNSKLYRFNIGPYTNEKAGGYYDAYSEELQSIVAGFIAENKQSKAEFKREAEDEGRKGRGGVVEEIIEANISKEEEDLRNGQESVAEVFRMKEEGTVRQVYQTLAKGGPEKPRYVRLAGQLPHIDLGNFDWAFCLKYQLFSKLPKHTAGLAQLPFFRPRQQLQIRTTINLNALTPRYLTFDPKGDLGITHKAYLDDHQTGSEIIEKQQLKVLVDNGQGGFVKVQADLNEVFALNCATVYKRSALGHLLFEDSVTCNYSSSFVKLKLVECCYLLQPLVCQMDFSSNTPQLLELQQLCAKTVFQQIDLRHLVHQGIDNSRYTGIDVGRLAYYGQGNCHHLASVTAALLLPFGKLLGWDIIFRAGSFFKTGRELDQEGHPAKGWNGKPNVNVEDHTWLEIRYKPSNQTFVFDPSFAICSSALDEVYSFNGRMHISGKKPNFALDYQPPQQLWPQ